MAIHIDFEPVGRRGDCPAGQSLLDYARRLGVDLVNLCGGTGSCGRCVVQVVAGNVSDPESGESEFLTRDELAAGYRLACRTWPLGDCKVRVPAESLTTPQRTQVEGELVLVTPEPPVQTFTVALSAPDLDDLRADTGRLRAALEQQDVVVSKLDLHALRGLPSCLREGGWQAAVAVRDGEIVAVGRPEARSLGLAVDLGTTKIAAYLVDLETGETLASQGIMNPQIAYGEDIVARMGLALQSPADAVRMQAMIVDVLNHALDSMCPGAGTTPQEVVEAVIVGNTAMHHLFLGLPVGQLARAPYVPAVDAALDVKARDLGLNMAPGGYVHLLPNIAGYVGADHVAMLLAVEIAQAQGVVLAMDIGTNTEVCLANRGRLTSLSCASGPAFEGAHIRHGMRAADGAIERLQLRDGRIEYKTIGDVPAVGLCGSGILDALAQLYLAGVVDARGRMGQHPNVRETDGRREFVLVDEAESGGDRQQAITFTQKDVRELQLAKGAMRTGVDVLLEINGLVEGEIDQVIIAGAFGTYIDVASAMAINMLPHLPLDRFRQVGNAAGMGAKLALISRQERAKARELASRVGYVELATVPDFTKKFAQSMYLG